MGRSVSSHVGPMHVLDSTRLSVVGARKYQSILDTGVRYTAVDTRIFAQLVLYATVENDGDLPAYLPFGCTDVSVWDAEALVRTARASSVAAGMQLVLLTFRDAAIRAAIRGTDTCAFTAFLFGPHDDGTYLGLADTGPTRLPLQMWRRFIAEEAAIHLDTLLVHGHSESAATVMACMDANTEDLIVFTDAPPQ